MTKPRMILIWGREDILSASIEAYLADVPDCQVISITTQEDIQEFVLPEQFGIPDIVIINQTSTNQTADLPLRLLHCHPSIKVITIRLEDNLMEIYSKQNILVQQTSDLLGAIEDP
jgi:hypothetical protein